MTDSPTGTSRPRMLIQGSLERMGIIMKCIIFKAEHKTVLATTTTRKFPATSALMVLFQTKNVDTGPLEQMGIVMKSVIFKAEHKTVFATTPARKFSATFLLSWSWACKCG
ncbi:uncharacterized protein LOC120109946 isoform X2 [Phoenix dactylifera]|uniref:Uncharacterized protein LOC120109946 isoform X2 n=1 Tax=Phoenix dactylifera TaxID=42345 RepID=A0A8B9A239_PHODC|nr:uncharacterized protein LOC120109946 isoform X2 [Phoenix dactylifera]